MTPPTKAALLPVELLPCPFCGVAAEVKFDEVAHPDNKCVLRQIRCSFAAWNTRTRPALPDDVGAVMERLRGLAYNHTAPGDGIGRNTYGEAATLIETLSADREGVEAALKVAHEALLNYACHGGPDLPCKRAAYQCRAECGKQAGDALLAISAIRERGGR